MERGKRGPEKREGGVIMKKTIAMTLLVFGLIIGFAAPAVLAAEQTSRPENGDKAEKEWKKE